MDPALRQQMLAYYDERASEYEEAYRAGTGTSSIPDPPLFTAEAASLSGVVARFGHGRLIDIACGTGYWLPFYAGRCERITLIDQSANMLRECERKVSALGIADRCAIVCADVLDYASRPVSTTVPCQEERRQGVPGDRVRPLPGPGFCMEPAPGQVQRESRRAAAAVERWCGIRDLQAVFRSRRHCRLVRQIPSHHSD
jgi:hypothetical protein